MEAAPSLRLFAPAKINLCLKITGRRPDAYHDLLSLMLALDFGDELNCTEKASLSDLGLSGESNDPTIPFNQGSLLEKSFKFISLYFNYKKGVYLKISKNIPIGAGLGGGSSDAATLIQAVEHWQGDLLPETEYPRLAYEVGADVPFFLAAARQRSTLWLEGIGEQLSQGPSLPELFILLVNPGLHISTKEVYQTLPRDLTSLGSAVMKPASFKPLAWEALLSLVTNDLESVVLPRYPAVRELKANLLGLGADAALMSGSGSTVFGLFSQKESCERASAQLRAQYPSYWVKVAQPLY